MCGEGRLNVTVLDFGARVILVRANPGHGHDRFLDAYQQVAGELGHSIRRDYALPSLIEFDIAKK